MLPRDNYENKIMEHYWILSREQFQTVYYAEETSLNPLIYYVQLLLSAHWFINTKRKLKALKQLV